MRLDKTLRAWRTPDRESVLKRELEALHACDLPLQEGLTRGNHLSEDAFRVMLIGTEESATSLRATVGIFYTGLIAGCSCADDPTPLEGHPEYSELRVEIDKVTAEASFLLLPG